MMNNRLPCYLNIFSEQNWLELDKLVNEVEHSAQHLIEAPQCGDSRNEPVNINVLRLVARKKNRSLKVNRPYSTQFLSLLKQVEFLKTIQEYTQIKKLKILRMQLNLMGSGAFVAMHTDLESDSSYLFTAVLRTKSIFEGGDLVLYSKDKLKKIRQPDHSVFLMNASIEHEVKTVESGFRHSLIVVFGLH